jgi:hypothetical protein
MWNFGLICSAVTPGEKVEASSLLREGQDTLIKKKIKFFLIYKEIQDGAVAKSYITNGLLIYGEIFAHFLIY